MQCLNDLTSSWNIFFKQIVLKMTFILGDNYNMLIIACHKTIFFTKLVLYILSEPYCCGGLYSNNDSFIYFKIAKLNKK